MLNMKQYNTEQFDELVRQWADAWNRRDIDAVLAHYPEQISWCSPLVHEVMASESAWLHGKQQVRDYFERALARISYLHFTVNDYFVSPSSLAIDYTNQNGKRLLDTFHWSEDGVIERVICYRMR